MSIEDDIETLMFEMNECLTRATALKLEFAARLIQMTLLELSDRSLDSCSKPAERPKEASPRLQS